MASSTDFRVPSLIVSGVGSALRTHEVLDRLGIARVVLVTDRNLGSLVSPIVHDLQTRSRLGAVYEGVMTEPSTTHVEEILALVGDTGADGLVAVGGGSPIDAAKAAAAMANHAGSINDYQGYDKFQNNAISCVAIPTTAGTGSEATRVVVITDPERRVKMMLMADQLMAAAAVVDPTLMVSCPPQVTASAGVDALTHAIEAYVSRRAQPLTDILALSACTAISGAIRRAFTNGEDLGARTSTAIGALEAGMAFSNSSVALIHGMSRPLGAVFGVPHGIANAMLLSAVMRFSLEGSLERYGDVGDAMGLSTDGASDEQRALQAVSGVESLMVDLRIPTLGGFGLNREAFDASLEKMADDAIESGSPANNPIVPSREQIVDLYEASF